MSLPPTLIIADQDEDRTQVDQRSRRGEASAEGLGKRWTRAPVQRPIAAIGRWSRHLFAYRGLLAALPLVIAAGGVVYHQRQAIENLNSAIVALGASRMALPVSPSRELEIGTASWPLADRAPDVFVRESDAGKRAALELEGATLLATNDFQRARIHYSRLVSLFPDEPAFQDVVRVLGTKLRCGSKCP